MEGSPHSNDQYTVGWVCALIDELVAAMAMLDCEHGNPQTLPRADNNTYVLGSIGHHKVVLACLPLDEQGHISAARVATDMIHAFPQIRFALVVGIGGGIPHYNHDCSKTEDIRLGDVVVGCNSETGGIVRYDFGKRLADGTFRETYALNRPPRLLATAVSNLEARRRLGHYRLGPIVDKALEKSSCLRDDGYGPPDRATDQLFHSEYVHVSEDGTCMKCDEAQAIHRGDSRREGSGPAVHYGVIASGSQVVKHAPTREQIRQKYNAICVEMEAAGLMNTLPCLVIRGICDYADSHKNDLWQKYAAITAAAYAKTLLGIIGVQGVESQERAQEVLSKVQNTLSSVVNTVAELKVIATKDQNSKILEWLSPCNFSAQLQDILKQRERGTLRWFLDSDEFQAWLKTGKQTLFCPGIPGAGKTVVAATVVEHLHAIAQQNLTTVECLLLPSHIQQLHDECAIIGVQPPLERISDALLQTARMYERVYIIIDALDELYASDYDEHSRLLTEMFRLQQDSPVSILITSRFKSGIIPPSHDIQERVIEAHDDDLVQYINTRLERLRIRSNVSRASNGMFLLARLHMDHLRDKTSVGMLKKSLSTLSQGNFGLTETYQRAMLVIQHLAEDLRALAMNALSWVAYSRTALSSTELRHALATQPEMSDLDTDYLSDVNLIISSCGGLVLWDNETDVVRLVHYTLSDFLCSQQNLPHAHMYIMTTCITYLSFNSFEIGRCSSNDEFKMRQKFYPLYRYSAKHWGFHAANISSASMGIFSPFPVNSAEADFMSLFQHDHLSSIPCGITAVHLAAHFGLLEVLKSLVQAGHDVNSRDSKHQTPLTYAALRKQWSTVIYLLDSLGADSSLADSTTLAAREGHLESVVLLLGNGFILQNPNYGNQELTQMLLTMGVSHSIKNDRSQTPLFTAAHAGQLAVAKTLLDNGAHTEEVDSKGRTPLFYALLLVGGANPDPEDYDRERPILWASGSGYDTILRLLLQKGVSAESRSDGSKSPIIWAKEDSDTGDYQAVVSQLVEFGADVNTKDETGTPIGHVRDKSLIKPSRISIQ
ncbi:hypothetical protein BO82DRAFT_381107 [Aspergillus uvarum CBS 121591]|uniref:Uncharacterized protein n=1 Tax=Aspergillus uvarum CBS 121591 TaxID=1448315 RepID=A0A319CGV3_9EURO|nr:hypothetical protein BO82DRAFT_381107 [Aspergillus uvarum CBS 121591]PYH85076.1 hypothetical protein BO82DRAFT_381107 [Aspergillus uvarum CBS 121591]